MQLKQLILFILGKMVKMFILLAALCLLSFWMVSNSPVDPVQAYVGADMMLVGPEQLERISAYWGVDKPPIEQFGRWASALLQGDLGTSMIFRRPVASIIKERFFASLILMGLAWTLSGLVGFALGIVAGMKQNTWVDKAIKSYCLILASTPTFWLGLILLIIFAVWLNWFPLGLAVPAGVLTENVRLIDRIHHLILPALTLSVLGVANIALHTRQKLVEVLSSEYVLLARARGASETEILWRHGIRNIALPAITLQFASLSELFGGSVLAETVFSYPGLGRATVQAGLRSDVPLLLGCVIFSAVFVFSGNLIADTVYRVVDPRIRHKDGAV